MSRAALQWVYPSSKSLKTDVNSCTKQWECLLFENTWAQISSRDARFIFSLHVGAVVWPRLPDRDTFPRCFDLGFHDQMASSKSTTSQKACMQIWACQNTPWNLCTSANHNLNTWYNVSSMMQRPISLNVFQMLNGLRMCIIDAHFKMFWSSMLDFAWETQCRATVY